MSNEGLDNLFKKGLSGRNVEFNMASWQHMEEMLPPEKKSKGLMYGASSLIIGAVALLGTAVFVLSATDVIFDSSQETVIVENTTSGKNIGSTIKEQNTTPVKTEVTNTSFQKDVSNDEEIARIDAQGESDVENAYPVVKTKSVSETENALNSSIAQENTVLALNEDLSGESYAESNEKTDDFGSGNLFTKILGIGELSTLLLPAPEEHTIIANTTNSLPQMSKNELGFIGGVNINTSLVADASSKLDVSEMFGVTYQRYLNGGFSIKSNLLYSARSGVNTQKLHDKKIYGFGSVTEQTLVETQRLVYIELPVMANYSFGNHNVLGGASFSYLVSCLNKNTTETTVQSESPSYSESTEWADTEGFNPYDFSLVAGYEYNVKPNLNIGMRLNYGLLDVTKNAYFGSDSFDNNVQFRVYLTYSPFHF